MKVVITGTGFSDSKIENALLESAGWEVVATNAVSPAEVLAVARDAEALLVQYASLDADAFNGLPSLRIVSCYGTGVDNIDLQAAEHHGVTVTNVPLYGGDEVALHATSLILASVRHLRRYDHAVRSGSWDYQATGPLTAPAELSLGLLGIGRIGSMVAERAGPWFGEVVAHDLDPSPIDRSVRLVGLDELFVQADVLSLHVPLTEATRGVVDRRRLRMLGPGGYLVNTARGGLVVLDDLVTALDAGELAGAALDVLPDEPPPSDHAILRHTAVLLTPHAAWYSTAAEADVRQRAAQNIIDWREGKVVNKVTEP